MLLKYICICVRLCHLSSNNNTNKLTSQCGICVQWQHCLCVSVNEFCSLKVNKLTVRKHMNLKGKKGKHTWFWKENLLKNHEGVHSFCVRKDIWCPPFCFYNTNLKIKWSCYTLNSDWQENLCSSYCFLTLAVEVDKWSASCPEPDFNESNNMVIQSSFHAAF
jgi:hypothetical protein